jgi:hypothetical protein
VSAKKQQQATNRTALAKERLRRSYRPNRVRVLFVGEAPPASGRFFYHADSGLYRAVRDTFVHAFPTLSQEGFLESFRDRGCYLVDLCGRPVDRLDRKRRKQICRDGEDRLSRILNKYHPSAVITLVRSIEANVRRAKLQADWSGQSVALPYPGRWHRHRLIFERKLIGFLRQSQ